MAGAGDTMKMEIDNQLVSINAVVAKIKQELHEIIEITQGDGSLNSALENAIASLLSLAKKTGVSKDDLAVDSAEEEDATANELSVITTRYITEQLKSLSHN